MVPVETHKLTLARGLNPIWDSDNFRVLLTFNIMLLLFRLEVIYSSRTATTNDSYALCRSYACWETLTLYALKNAEFETSLKLEKPLIR